jgi:hypothetical protein
MKILEETCSSKRETTEEITSMIMRLGLVLLDKPHTIETFPIPRTIKVVQSHPLEVLKITAIEKVKIKIKMNTNSIISMVIPIILAVEFIQV